MDDNSSDILIPPLPSANTPLTEEQLNLLKIALGEKKCNQSNLDKSINYLALAIILTLIFILLLLPGIDNILACLIPDFCQRFLFKVLLFFLLVYLFDRIITEWRNDQVFCE